MMFNIVGLFAAFSWLHYALAADLPAIEIYGNKFFYSNNGTRFFLKGVAYQQDSAGAKGSSKLQDPLGDFSICSRDIPYLQKLNTNVIRVYALNVTLDHSKCMKALNDAGIYVIADLSEPDASINRDEPSWDLDLYKRYTSVIDMMHNYTNVLGFFAGNEVTNNSTNTKASAFVKAAVRDSKAYIKSKGYRQIPVGYSTNDDQDTRVAMVDYFLCGSEEERADFYGINMYEWCGKSSFQVSGYADRTKELSHVDVPLFFSEYGCNENRPRLFTEVEALYGDDMIDVWSGGIVYMYFEEDNKYGLVKIDNSAVSPLPDFTYYSNEIKKVSPTALNSKSYSTFGASIACPTTDSNWAPSSSLPPTPNEQLCSCMSGALSCVVNDKIDEEDYETLFNYVCSKISCAGITANATSARYGSFSFCSPKEKLSFVLDAYYKSQGQSSNACSFDGSATLKKATTATGCASALQAVGSAGVGSFTGTLDASNSGKATAKASGSAATGSGETGKATNSSKPSSNAAAAAAGKFAFDSNLPALIACAAVLTSFGAIFF